MMKRHAKSRHILGIDVLSAETVSVINLNDPKIEERLATEFDYYETTGTTQSHPLFHHVAVREQYCDLAQSLSDGIHSAMYYSYKETRVTVLVEVNAKKRLLLYNITSGLFEHENDSLEVLDLIRCEQNTERALINPGEVENATKHAVRLWCEKEGVKIDKVAEICAIYLLPKPKKRSIRTILSGAVNYKKRRWNGTQQ